MNATYCKRGFQNRRTHKNHFLTALFVAAMVMILTVPAFAAEVTGITSVSISTPDLVETPADENEAFSDDENDASEPLPAPTTGPISTLDELIRYCPRQIRGQSGI